MEDSTEQKQIFQSLYRRFRPQKFSSLKGQDFVATALRNAVKANRVGHAYLFSGPRGTGKTSTARILAKALNCTELIDGEPCGECSSCVEVVNGTSLDVHELDAASNNGVDAMRELVSRAGLGSPGRWKVYIIDEVHMLSVAASNALLKTLEEPPSHVVFVLATTDPQKVLPTIRSRTQHFEFHLLNPSTLRDLLEEVRDSASLEIEQSAIEVAMRRGKGSARDALSALDLLASSGEVDDDAPEIDEVIACLVDKDAGSALIALEKLYEEGHDPATIAVELIEYLRNGFLSLQSPMMVDRDDPYIKKAEDHANALGLSAVVRVIETLGKCIVEMRDSPDSRINLEVAFVRLANPDADGSYQALVDRVTRLERRLKELESRPELFEVKSGQNTWPGGSDLPSQSDSKSRPSLGSYRRASSVKVPDAVEKAESKFPSKSNVETATDNSTGKVENSRVFERDEIVQAWGDKILPSLTGKLRSVFQAGRFIGVEAGNISVMALPNEAHRNYCESLKDEVEIVMSQYFKSRISIQLVVENKAPKEQMIVEEKKEVEVEETSEAVLERIAKVFPGAEEITE